MKLTTFSKLALVLFVTLILAADAKAFYDPNKGRFLSRDPIGENGGLNLSSIGANDLVNGIDPFGLERFQIWASAYIPDKTFRFPYPEGLDWSARWYGDNRTGVKLGGSSRAYHLIVIETDPIRSPVIQNFSAGGLTKVDYNFGNWGTPFVTPGDFWKPFTDLALDAAPPKATITRSPGNRFTWVTFAADTSDPLVHAAPSLHYGYTLEFDTCSEKLTIKGDHKVYPAYDLIVNGAAHVNYVPTGWRNFPGSLASPIRDSVGPIVVPWACFDKTERKVGSFG